MNRDERLTAALLFAAELERGLAWEALDREEVRRAVAARRRLAPATRYLERVALGRGWLGYDRHVAEPLVRARRAVLGDGALGPPKLLVRVDEFPHARAWDDPGRYGAEQFGRFHEIMRSAGVPYLVAVPARVARAALDPDETAERELDAAELAVLGELQADGVAFGAHGWNHRTREAKPRRRSELAGLDPAGLGALLDRIEAGLAAIRVEAPVFVAPFNRFEARQLPELARRYEVVCGGPETVTALGFRRTPIGLEGGVYLPGYPPLYGRAGQVLPAVRRLAERRTGLWTPVVLHWGWEADEGWEALRRLADAIAPLAASWQAFVESVRKSAGRADRGCA